MFEEMTEQQAREQILEMTRNYCEKYHNKKKPYQKGDRIPYASRVYDAEEMVNLVDSSLEFWLTAGRYTDEFEHAFAKYLGVRYCSLVNSGSSANLLAFMTLTSPLLKERQILPGDEVITVAAGFPTTVSPMIQYGAVPVFVDVTIPQYNIDPSLLEAAWSPKTKAVMLAHTLGNPFDLKAVREFCDNHNLWLIEDNCDALGSVYTINGEEKLTGTIGDIGTSSFYPVTENGQMFPCVQSDHPSFWMQGYNKPLPAWCYRVRFPDLHNSVVRSFPSPPHMYHFVHLLFRPFFPIMEKHVVVPCFC